jgi:DNA-binding transcriptional LysR family regulator
VIFYDATLAKEGKEWTFTGSQGDFQVRFSGNLETNSPIAFRAAALHGQGFIMTPAPIVIDDLKSGALVAVLSEFLPKQFSIDALYPTASHISHRLQVAAIPLPAALPLFATGLGALGLLGWRRKRKAKALSA